MNTDRLFSPDHPRRAWLALLAFVLVSLAAFITASAVQRDFGRVEVSNVSFTNADGAKVRAKLLRPRGASDASPAPGVVYMHGCQNNRETSDAYCIEMARRGFVVLTIDALGRGNSGNPRDMEDSAFDATYGGRTAFEHLKSLPYVNTERVGLMGHSLGAEMVYGIALTDPTVKALVISGFAYTTDATPTVPQNMLMIFGKYDEYRKRMTGTNDVAAEWISSPQTLAAFGSEGPGFEVTAGDFADGSARRVVLLPTIHIQESHSRHGIAEAVTWMRHALAPDAADWVAADSQIWDIKEYATLVAMVAGLAAVLPLALILIRTGFFSSLQGVAAGEVLCPRRDLLKHAGINGLLMWLYLPVIMILFAVHVYVVRIDKVFPMMMVNGTVWWFVITNLIGLFILRRWRKRSEEPVSWADLGVSYSSGGFSLDWAALGKTALLALAIFAWVTTFEAVLERVFVVDYRFLFPFASDLTPYRAGMWLLYFPFLLFGFLVQGTFLHGQIRQAGRATWWRTFTSWSVNNTLVLVVPLALFMLVQYVPLLTVGVIPFVGPGGSMASFTMNLFHIIGVLMMITPISTWCYQLTGRPYLGAILNAALVAWMFVSSQVIAPIPV